MGWNAWIRQIHRWLAVAFTLIVASIFAALGVGEPPQWLYYTPLPPLFLLMFTGIYLFALPHVARWRKGKVQS